jgi:hypothetical protein
MATHKHHEQNLGNLPRTVRNSKRNGELVEVAFLHKAVSLGFAASKPYGDSEPYDFILDADRNGSHQLWRVQVKSSGCNFHGAYHITAGHFSSRATKVSYTPEQIDFLVVCIVPEDAWYVLPIRDFSPRRYLSFFPHLPKAKSRGRYEHLRDAWHLMAPPLLPV